MSFECEVIRWDVTTSNGDQFGPVLSAILEFKAAGLRGAVVGKKIPPRSDIQPLQLETGTTGEAHLDNDDHEYLQVFAWKRYRNLVPLQS